MKKRTFRLYWLTDDTQDVSFQDLGNQYDTLAAAMNNAGIGGGALRALDYWREITEDALKELSK